MLKLEKEKKHREGEVKCWATPNYLQTSLYSSFVRGERTRRTTM